MTAQSATLPTPTPWAIGFHDGSGADPNTGFTITAGDHAVIKESVVVVASTRDEWDVVQGIRTRANAEAIVTAVNSHATLLAALDKILSQAKLFRGTQQTSAHKTLSRVADIAEQALAAAKMQEQVAQFVMPFINDDA